MKPLAYLSWPRLLLAGTLALLPSYGIESLALAQSSPVVPLVTPVNPQLISLTGTITGLGEADENEWVVSTDQGNVRVDAGPRWYHTIDLAMDEPITITGEFDNGELDAFRITRADGSVVNVRPYYGPPPWAGSPQSNQREGYAPSPRAE
ncbi:MAG: DNA-binding protein [Nodosilinea sp.]